MLSLTRKTDYALVALADLAKRRGSAEPAASARRIAEEYGLPAPLLMNILKELAQARIVVSIRGAQGGYTLAADPEQVTLLEVITAMEGPTRLADCTDRLPVVGQGCHHSAHCPVREPVRRLQERIHGFLETVTLAGLLESKVDVTLDRVTAGGRR